ncbi:MAG: hypothetical protein F6K25_02965 [Okeania sp. SIO2G4]|nr:MULTISPECIES: hypothetical protein [unclassified Okeania]NEP38172.1 hypothetical protein [Okeania sp. SIO2H7]NEP72773.1 hypothetical protein [Okeania sp. SIO2G5]NEP93463.1 hypothetical protein [Okeania sp. SIO2F5]NEQ89760.1 hypothetical protein [Okeania sp. SIO2G4]
MALLKSVYDINFNYLGVNPPPPLPGGEVRRTEPGERKVFFGQLSKDNI